MTNEVSFGQRIAAPLRWLAEQSKRWGKVLEPRPTALETQRAAYLTALLTLGRRALESENRSTFLQEGGLATIAACIEAGITERDEIIKTVQRHHAASCRHIGFLLGQHTGTDPAQHLWVRGPDRRYALLPITQ